VQCEKSVARNSGDAGRAAADGSNRDLNHLFDCFDDSCGPGAVTTDLHFAQRRGSGRLVPSLSALPARLTEPPVR